jgi:tRNA(Ile)-lysidine synthase
VAWSGGLDSTVLLDLIERVALDLGVEVCAVHVDHGLHDRSAEAAAFCRRRAHRRGIALRVEEVEVAEGGSVEARARQQRYAAIGRSAEALGADAVLTAHQADDAVETALLHMTRGTGLRGLTSLAPGRSPSSSPPIAGWPDLPLLRPLTGIERADLRRWADRRGLDWIDDPTNTSDEFARNRLRRRVLPELREEADGLGPLVRTLRNLSEDADIVAERVREDYDRCLTARPTHTSIAFQTERLARLRPALLAGVLRRAARQLPGGVRWNRETLEEAGSAVAATDEDGRPRHIVPGSGLLTVETAETILALDRSRGGRATRERRALPIPIDLEQTSGAIPWFDREIEWRNLEPDEPTDFPTDPDVAWLDRDRLPDRLLVRGPSPGERLAALGMEGSKSVRDLLRGGDVPESKRWRWPCISIPGGSGPGHLLWVGGLRQSRHATVDGDTRRVVELRIIP